MPTVPNIAQVAQPELNPLAKPSPTDLLMAAASMQQTTPVVRKPKGKPR